MQYEDHKIQIQGHESVFALSEHSTSLIHYESFQVPDQLGSLFSNMQQKRIFHGNRAQEFTLPYQKRFSFPLQAPSVIAFFFRCSKGDFSIAARVFGASFIDTLSRDC